MGGAPSHTPSRGEEGPFVSDSQNDPRVLMVDDEPADTAMIRDVLSQLGVGVVGAYMQLTDLLAALAHGDPPDLVLADLNLPDSQGTNTVEVLRAAHPQLPVVVVTGDPVAAQDAISAGADEVVTKDQLRSDLGRAVLGSLARNAGPVGAKATAFYLADAPLLVVDDEDRVVMANAIATRLLERPPDPSRQFPMLFVPKDRVEVESFLLSARSLAGQKVWTTARLDLVTGVRDCELRGVLDPRSGRVHVTLVVATDGPPP